MRALRLDCFSLSYEGPVYPVTGVLGGWDYLGRGIGLIAVIKSGRPGPYRLFSGKNSNGGRVTQKDPQKIVASLYLLGKDWLCNSRPILDQLWATPASMR